MNTVKPAGSKGQSSAVIRSQVARSLAQVLEQSRTIDWLLENRAEWLNSALAKELLYGTLRHYYSLHQQVTGLLDKPLRKKDLDLLCLLLVGAYQLEKLSVPAHAVINETVEACRPLHKPWAKGLVNALLRKVDRAAHKDTNRSFDPAVEYPTWLAQKLSRQYPTTDILAANMRRAPLALRINTCRTSVTDYLARLSSAVPQASSTNTADDRVEHVFVEHAFVELPEAVVLAQPQSAQSLPGWETGEVAIQDLGAQAASLIWRKYVHPREPVQSRSLRILDACAAPGGKLFHLLETLAGHNIKAEVTVLESNSRRAEHMLLSAQRLGHTVNPLVADAMQLDWWSGEPFDHVLLDAPCSGTGTLRRHPEIKLLLQPQQIEQHAQTQLQLLTNLWRTVLPGGTLLYCTCSLLEEENDLVVKAFLAKTANKRNPHADDNQSGRQDSGDDSGEATHQADVLALQLPSGEPRQCGWQLSPTDPTTDGFYYALLQKP